jgi:predicted 3-demethylubiquinone-9 3-methyltransferase (glyoxalase superfamily)
MQSMPNITPFLWFDDKAEEAVSFYMSIFKDSRLLTVARYGDAGPGPPGSVMTVAFELQGQKFIALNGGPHYSFTPAVSFAVKCETHQEIDHYWARLLEGGEENRCGWLTDKYGLSWQIVPTMLPELLQDKDPAKRKRVMETMLKMVKLDIDALKRA